MAKSIGAVTNTGDMGCVKIWTQEISREERHVNGQKK